MNIPNKNTDDKSINDKKITIGDIEFLNTKVKSSKKVKKKKSLKDDFAETLRRQKVQILIIEAIINKDIKKIDEIFEEHPKFNLNFKFTTKSVTEFAIQSFDENLMNKLVSHGLKINPWQFERLSVVYDNLEAMLWYDKSRKNINYQNIIVSAVYQSSIKIFEYYLNKILNSENPHINNIENYFSVYMRFLIDKERPDLIEKIYDSFADKISNFKKSSTFIDPWFINKLSPRQLGFCYELYKKNNAMFLTNLGNTAPNLPNNFYELIFISGNPVIPQMVNAKKGYDIFSDFFTKKDLLKSFLTTANQSVAFDTISKLKPVSENFKDNKNNNIAHMLLDLPDYQNKATANFIYSFNKNLFFEKNDKGLTPLDLMDDKIKPYISQKLIKKELNDNKIGLIHKSRTKTKKTKM